MLAGEALLGAERFVGGLDLDLGVGEVALGAPELAQAGVGFGVAPLDLLDGTVDELTGDAGPEHPQDSRDELASDPAGVAVVEGLFGARVDHVDAPAVDFEGFVFLQEDVEVGLVAVSAADQGHGCGALEVAAVEQKGVHTRELVALPLEAGDIPGLADRRQIALAQALGLDALTAGQRPGLGLDAELPHDVALGQGQVAAHTDPANRSPRANLNDDLALGHGQKLGPVAELGEPGRVVEGIENTRSQADDGLEARAAVPLDEAPADADDVDIDVGHGPAQDRRADAQEHLVCAGGGDEDLEAVAGEALESVHEQGVVSARDPGLDQARAVARLHGLVALDQLELACAQGPEGLEGRVEGVAAVAQVAVRARQDGGVVARLGWSSWARGAGARRR